MKKRIFSVLFAVIMVCAVSVTFVFATEPGGGRPLADVVYSDLAMPVEPFLDSGHLNNSTGLDTVKLLNRDNGQYVCLYVENHGTNAVVATINGEGARPLEPGESGHISVEVTQGLFGYDREYAFKVLTGTNGGTVNISYRIVQQDTP